MLGRRMLRGRARRFIEADRKGRPRQFPLLCRAGEHTATRSSCGKFADGEAVAAKQNSSFVMQEIRLRGAITVANELTEH